MGKTISRLPSPSHHLYRWYQLAIPSGFLKMALFQPLDLLSLGVAGSTSMSPSSGNARGNGARCFGELRHGEERRGRVGPQQVLEAIEHRGPGATRVKKN